MLIINYVIKTGKLSRFEVALFGTQRDENGLLTLVFPREWADRVISEAEMGREKCTN